MVPRRNEQTGVRADAKGARNGPGQDRLRIIEDAAHHPARSVKARKGHKPQKKQKLPPRHTPHSHPHGDELGPHANKPSPIHPPKTMTRTGAKKA